MITYTFTNEDTLTNQLYEAIKNDITNGTLKDNEKLPSKRALAKHLNISTITVENAYMQLLSEGYIYSKPRSGYYVAHILHRPKRQTIPLIHEEKKEKMKIDFSSNATSPDHFPFTSWAKVSRYVLTNKQKQLLEPMPAQGLHDLREAIAQHLLDFKDMAVSPSQIIIGAGTEYLYGLLIQFFGFDVFYGLETPGYATLSHVYEAYHVTSIPLPIDHEGVNMSALYDSPVDILHVTPGHHFPTGITMPINRRVELLSWVNASRYIIEDDYDSEFRMMGKPLPSLFSIDTTDHVIYMNTFTKTLSSTVRVSYMVLPVHLVEAFKKKLSFYNCSVSSFEQEILASFIQEGYFEKHINRMRTIYRRKRNEVLHLFTSHPLSSCSHISEENAGLHFLLTIDRAIDVNHFKEILKNHQIKIKSLEDYGGDPTPTFIINYSSLSLDKLPAAFDLMYDIIKEEHSRSSY